MVYPPITVPPQEFVSRPLVEALLQCDGLMYPDSVASMQSFWVAFERDIATRAGLRIYRFQSATGRWRRDFTPPLPLRVFFSFARRDFGSRVSEIADFMRRERHFRVQMDASDVTASDSLPMNLSRVLRRHATRGYFVLFWSPAAAGSRWVELELALTSALSSRIVVAVLDDTPLPASLAQFSLVRMGRTSEPLAHGIDELIARLYWLFHQVSTEQGARSPTRVDHA